MAKIMGNISEKERYNQKEELNIYSKTKTVVKRIVILIAALAIISVFLYYENNHLETTGYEYDSDKVPKEFNGLRIVQISDLHNATFGDNNLELYQQVAKIKPDMVFTGHEHGGQFRLPLVGAVIAPDQGLFPELTEGVHTEGNTTMYISRGLGNSVIPFRLFNDPEIVYVVINQ